jgi:hypothetical protein
MRTDREGTFIEPNDVTLIVNEGVSALIGYMRYTLAIVVVT